MSGEYDSLAARSQHEAKKKQESFIYTFVAAENLICTINFLILKTNSNYYIWTHTQHADYVYMLAFTMGHEHGLFNGNNYIQIYVYRF